MKSTTGWVVAGIIIILLAGAGFYYFFVVGSTTQEAIPYTPQIETSSIKGCYVAKLAKDVYTLNIQTEGNGIVSGTLAYNNFEKDSSSGTLSGTYDGSIILGSYIFNSEGMQSNRQVIFKKSGNNFIQGFGPVKMVGGREVFVDTKDITYDPNSTFVKSPDCKEVFTDSNNNVSFTHSSLFPTREGGSSTKEWELDGKQDGTILAKVTVPQSFLPNTNFINAYLTVGRSGDTNAIKGCSVKDSGSNGAGVSATVGGFPFKKFTLSDAGAGNFYETTSYKGIVDGDCYAVEYTIHSTNIGNYSPNQGIKEFNKSKVQNELEAIVTSLKFLVNSD